jgi:Mg-chelatase subunit ChlD
MSRAARHGQTGGPQLFFLLRHQLRGQYRRIFRELARFTIIRSAIRISGQGLRPEILTEVPFYPGLDEFDLEATLEDVLSKTDFATYADIVGVERIAQKKIGTIILDTSGSMSGLKLLTAATAAAVAAYHLRHDKYAFIAFNTLASTIKAMNQRENIDHLVDTILDTEPAGYTNIADGLHQGFEQYRRAGRRESWAILITDGIANRGDDPEPYARRFRALHVLQTPGTYTQGDETCQRLARLGGGRHIKVQDYTSVPRALMHLLYQT